MLLGLVAVYCAAQAETPRLTDHHQHLFSPAIVAGAPTLKVVTGKDLVARLDAAGIGRAVVLSTAYQFGNPNKPPFPDEYARVVAENDWTAAEAAASGGRLIPFCSFNPLKDYALAELERCAGAPGHHRGLKLHFGNSDVQLEEPGHREALRRVFAAANARRMPIVVHMRPSVTRQRPFGAAQAQAFIEHLLPAAPDIVVQIAHLAGAGGYEDPGIDAALGVFVDAVKRRDPRLAQVYFDISGVVGVGDWLPHASTIAIRLRGLGLERILFGSDGAVSDDSMPLARLTDFRKLPLSEAELRRIEANVAPYLRGNVAAGLAYTAAP
jgi:predicted TIM-barrel fold metal-dependent hydrolase